jgi:hypothetical protein
VVRRAIARVVDQPVYEEQHVLEHGQQPQPHGHETPFDPYAAMPQQAAFAQQA